MHENKVYLVTGSSSGIGLATTRVLLEAGAKVAGLDINMERNEAMLETLDPDGMRTLAVTGDVSLEEDNQRAIAAAVEKFGKISGAALCAGINGMWTPIEKLTVEDWDRTLRINLRSGFLAIKHLIKPLKANHGGSIVLVSSIEGTVVKGSAGATVYAVSKSAQVTLAEKAASELARYQIRVNAVLPGGVRTNIRENTQYEDVDEIHYPIFRPTETENPLLQRSGEARHIADPISFLLSDQAEFITGASLLADGAQRFMRG